MSSDQKLHWPFARRELSALWTSDRLRRCVDPAAGFPSRFLAQAVSASRTLAVSCSAATGSEARCAQSRAAATFSRGAWSRATGLNA